MPVLQKKALFSAFIICQVLRIIQNYMEVSPAKSLILSATIHGGSYFFIQPRICVLKLCLFQIIQFGYSPTVHYFSMRRFPAYRLLPCIHKSLIDTFLLH